jgi:type IV pilus assembly protein PilB
VRPEAPAARTATPQKVSSCFFPPHTRGTAYGRAADRAEALESGYDRHIAKPVTPEGLANVVATLLRENPAGWPFRRGPLEGPVSGEAPPADKQTGRGGAMTSSSESRLGELLVKEGLITERELGDALAAQAASHVYLPLGQILFQRGLVTARQLNLLLETADKRPRLGELLQRSRAITAEQLSRALAQQKKAHRPLGQILVKLGYVTDETIRQALALQLNVAYVDLDRIDLDPPLARLINKYYARRHSLVPIASEGQMLTVCMDDPTDRATIEDLGRSTGFVVTVVTSSHEAIRNAFARLYDEERSEPTASVPAVPDGLDLTLTEEKSELPNRYLDEYREQKRGDAIVRQLLLIALERRVSDIHLETLSTQLQVRFRIDGVLQALKLGPLQEACNQAPREVMSRLKILGKLDIAERRRPQDGSFRVRVERGGAVTTVDFRISIVPGYYGESVVLRLLDRRGAPASIDDLGFSPTVLDSVRHLISQPSGMLLVTGPTGCGKTTTLYAVLMTVYRPEIRILTAEDPVEYVYEQFSQSEVNEGIGNTFASYLRAFLRHDPEVIMVGEIRDEETAAMAFRAAQTGHLLLSTLHTNSAVASVARLLDLNVDSDLVASSLNGVIAQRLVRRICPACKEEYAPSPALLKEFFETPPAGLRFYRGRGCAECNLSGYRGRTSVVELWVPNDEDRLLITKHASLDEIKASARPTTIAMAEDVMRRLADGTTNLEELIRMLPYAAIFDFRQAAASRAAFASPAAVPVRAAVLA